MSKALVRRPDSQAMPGGRGKSAVNRGRRTGPRKNGKKRTGSLAEQAYQAIKHEIITCGLRPGEYLNESQLCQRLGIGRTPVHQAIGQLHQERFLDVIPRKGIIVRPVSLDEYFNLDEVRLLLEVGAMRVAAERITKSELDELGQILERGRAARKARDIEQLHLVDRDFHFMLADSTRNPVLAGMLKAAYERALRVWFVSSANLIIDEERDEHERIVKALARRDGDAAAQIMREHILSSRAYTMRSS